MESLRDVFLKKARNFKSVREANTFIVNCTLSIGSTWERVRRKVAALANTTIFGG